jgi:hypothetical protein
MTKHLRLLATVATVAALTAAAACDRVVELSSIDAPPFEPPPFFLDAGVIDAPVVPWDSPPPGVDAPVFIDAPYGTDAAVVIDAPFAAPPASPTSERTRT